MAVNCSHRFLKALVRLALFLGLSAVFWAYGFPVYVDAFAVVVFAGCAILTAKRKLALILATLIFSAFLVEAAIRFILPEDDVPTYYRPHEKYDQDGVRYQSYVDVRYPLPYGDLSRLDPLAPAAIREPRTIHFKTDRFGHRNDTDYRGQELIICGDSFIVGNGTDQKDILANVLRRDHGIDVYSIAYPESPHEYFKRIRLFLSRANKSVSVLLFIFEGNDFLAVGRRMLKPTLYQRQKLSFARAVTPVFKSCRYIFHKSCQLENLLFKDEGPVVEVVQVGHRQVGFYGSYVDMAISEFHTFPINNLPLKVVARMKAVFFIPTKYRVYFGLLDDQLGRRLPTPSPGYLVLKKIFEPHHIPVIDLSEALQASARQLLSEDKYVFWRGDTHWNGNGIKTAAIEVAAFLGSAPGMYGAGKRARTTKNKSQVLPVAKRGNE